MNWCEKIGIIAKKIKRTDTVGFIGRRYLEKDLGHRVFQIYADSRRWEPDALPKGFFDSVLIDGGHEPAVVMNDTRKAFEMARPGGLVMWHDFCPPVHDRFTVTQNIMKAFLLMWPNLKLWTQRLFWINPSHILVGIKKQTGPK